MFDQSFLSIYHLSDIVPYRGKQEKRYNQDTKKRGWKTRG